MYWNDTPQSNIDDINRININMRCIEIAIYDFFATDKYRLTLTWDVLKCNIVSFVKFILNMININMRCIEIWINDLWKHVLSWLTLTWDVLKWVRATTIRKFNWININMRCIEIILTICISWFLIWININMRCIEMKAEL